MARAYRTQRPIRQSTRLLVVWLARVPVGFLVKANLTGSAANRNKNSRRVDEGKNSQNNCQLSVSRTLPLYHPTATTKTFPNHGYFAEAGTLALTYCVVKCSVDKYRGLRPWPRCEWSANICILLEFREGHNSPHCPSPPHTSFLPRGGVLLA